MSTRTPYEELDSTTCFCGRKKSHGKSFCYDCWCKLPRGIQDGLYESVGYQETHDTARRIIAQKKFTEFR